MSTHYIEGLRAVNGSGEYISDIPNPPGTMYMAIYRSYLPHGIIKKVDVSEVFNHGGIAFTNTDLLRIIKNPFPLALNSPINYYPVANKKVRFVGEPLAIVLSRDYYKAIDLLEYVNADLEPIIPVINIQDALEKKALIHEELGSNIAMSRKMTFGDVEETFSNNIIIRNDFKIARHSSAPLETYGILAYKSDLLNIIANFQGPMLQVHFISRALGIPENQIRLLTPRDIGGSFGIKYSLYPYMTIAAAASILSGHPIRWIESRTENFISSSASGDREGYVELASDRTGKIKGIKYKFYEDVGAYPRPPEPGALFRVQGNLNGAYDIRNIQAEYVVVLTNKSPTGLNRGYGAPQFYFALETAVDKLADELKMDPLEIRKRNLIKVFDKKIGNDYFYETSTGGLYPKQDYERVINTLEEEYRKFKKEPYVGIGISVFVEPSGTNLGYVDLSVEGSKRRHTHSASGDYVIMSVNYDGTISVFVNGTNEGLGHETVIAETVAREFCIDPEKIKVEVRIDTSIPWTLSSGSYSSRFAPIVMSAVIKASEELKNRLKDIAKKYLEAKDVSFSEGKFSDIQNPSKVVDLKTLASAFHWDPYSAQGNLSVVMYYSSPFLRPPDNDRINSSLAYGIQAQMAIVKIDPLTYDVKIEKFIIIHDVGKILKKELLEGQVLGSLFHGIDMALYEKIAYDDNGNPIVTTFDSYETPTFSEALGIDVEIKHFETITDYLPSKAFGAGEGPIMGVPSTILNAISNAIGKRITQIPISPEKIMKIIKGD
ncbi:xanthine dehydrogenase family protein molybdopterin-binding subunit [Acidianus brierleyi]|uniref:Xanthine dehydrogenase n=1 Tax=Acidianus brierleyi TaxID=41673 RepID=A0A2U9IIE7_9CREN|nr:xanthine dehydrogenase family protein molybdopterin-binding subunit [Acidianus brierleyi]AWR95812.1 molybdopterin-dependent oxidoreductase [Acidianus brierleyi]